MQDIEYVLSKRRYSDIVGPYDAKFEEDHNAVHDFIGGHMADLACAPSDPLFWLEHVFIDCVFEKFRRYSQYTWPEKDYPVGMYGELSNEHKAYAFMEPFRPIYNIHGLSNHYTNYYYQCAPRPVHCKSEAECQSQYLWCDTSTYRCRSKIKILGRCDGLPNEACQGNSQCYHNVCSKPFKNMDHSSYYFPFTHGVSSSQDQHSQMEQGDTKSAIEYGTLHKNGEHTLDEHTLDKHTLDEHTLDEHGDEQYHINTGDLGNRMDMKHESSDTHTEEELSNRGEMKYHPEMYNHDQVEKPHENDKG